MKQWLISTWVEEFIFLSTFLILAYVGIHKKEYDLEYKFWKALQETFSMIAYGEYVTSQFMWTDNQMVAKILSVSGLDRIRPNKYGKIKWEHLFVTWISY